MSRCFFCGKETHQSLTSFNDLYEVMVCSKHKDYAIYDFINFLQLRKQDGNKFRQRNTDKL